MASIEFDIGTTSLQFNAVVCGGSIEGNITEENIINIV
jgi:hypothetical protein